jgi:PPOX class probable FMN-dependent enzyme
MPAMARIENGAQLRAIMGEPSAPVQRKIHRCLSARARQFIASAPLVLVSTADARGQSTVSPRGDAGGFVRVVDDETLLIPERPGNKLLFSLQNLLVNPRVGLLFLVPGTAETLRVGGEAELRDDADLCALFPSRGRIPLLVVRVRVTACYFHCAKAFLRSELWNPASWPARMAISLGQEIAEEGGLEGTSVAEFDAGVDGRYKTDL